MQNVDDSADLVELLLRVIPRKKALEYINETSAMTWSRLDAAGEGPPITQISARCSGYRVLDLIKWLDGRRRGEGQAARPPLREEIAALRALYGGDAR